MIISVLTNYKPKISFSLYDLKCIFYIVIQFQSNKNLSIENYKNLRTDNKTIKFLNPYPDESFKKKTLVLDLDETLIHSAFSKTDKAPIILQIPIENKFCSIYVQIRPGAKYFLEETSKIFEVVIFTASLSKYADPLIDQLDESNWWTYRLYREHWTTLNSMIFIKDLVFLDRDLKNVIIIDNSPNSYAFQQENALPISSWYGNSGKFTPTIALGVTDTSLYQLLPILHELSKVDDVRTVIPKI